MAFSPMDGVISIHSPRMGRDCPRRNLWERHGISIHSPRMGRDRFGKFDNIIVNHISIHSPRMGRDPTLSISPQIFSISIHSPRMGRDGNFRHI